MPGFGLPVISRERNKTWRTTQTKRNGEGRNFAKKSPAKCKSKPNYLVERRKKFYKAIGRYLSIALCRVKAVKLIQNFCEIKLLLTHLFCTFFRDEALRKSGNPQMMTKNAADIERDVFSKAKSRVGLVKTELNLCHFY